MNAWRDVEALKRDLREFSLRQCLIGLALAAVFNAPLWFYLLVLR